MATYIPNATQTAEPTEDRTVESAALEFRTLKTSVNARIDAVQNNVDAEAAARGADDLTEVGLRTAADGVLQAQINAAAVVQANQRLQYLRVPESSVDALPEAGTRAGKVLGFDASGKPIPVAVSGASDPSLRADLAQPTGSALVGFQQPGTDAVARTSQAKLRESVSVKDFGAVGDGVSDDSEAIQNAIASSLSIFFPPGNYLVTTQIAINASDIKLHGVGAASKITSATLRNVIRLTGLNRAVFEDLAFETTVNNATENSYGVVWSEDHPLTDVSFLRCYFYAPNANTNGVKIINQDADISDQVRFVECRFEGIQRMCIELQNHVYDGDVRYRSIAVERCVFKDIGVGIGYGYAISLSGKGENCSVINNTFDNVRLGLELVGASDTTVAFNKFRSFGVGGRPFSFTGTNVEMFRNRVIGNTMEARGGGPVFYTQRDFVMQGNYWLTTGSMNARDLLRCRFSDEQFDSTGASAVFIEGNSSDNQFVNCRISNQSSLSNQATFRTSGSGTTDTRLIGCHIIQGAGGVSIDAVSSAQRAVFILHKSGIGGSPISDPFRIGAKTSLGARKVAGAGVFTTTVTIDFGTAPSWEPAVVKLKIASNAASGGSGGYTENVLSLRHVTGSVALNSNQVIGTASALTVTTSASGNVLTLTCTHATAAANTYMWDVEVSCVNNPVVA